MNEAQRFDTTTGGELASPTSDWPIGEIEGPISGLRNTIGIMEHMATSAHEVTRDEWATMTTILSGYAKQIDDLWEKAFEQHVSLREEHRKALAAAKAEKAAPGSIADIQLAKAMWRMMRIIMQNSLDACREAEAQHAAVDEVKKW